MTARPDTASPRPHGQSGRVPRHGPTCAIAAALALSALYAAGAQFWRLGADGLPGAADGAPLGGSPA